MSIIEAIILGLIQGLTEFIPVSSSGHLDILPKILGFATPSTSFITFLHFGTLISLLIFFRLTIIRYLRSLLKFIQKKELNESEKKDLKIITNLVIATIPAAVIGVVLEKIISNFYDSPENSRISAIFILLAMIIVGTIFLFANKLFTNNKKEIGDLNNKNALVIGISQTFAFFRGVSRSGITLLTGQSLGLSKVAAAEFGFLMSIPIMIATSAYSTYELIKLPSEELSAEIAPALIGFIVAAISGYVAIKFLLNYLKTKGLAVFGVYRIVFGIVALAIILLR